MSDADFNERRDLSVILIDAAFLARRDDNELMRMLGELAYRHLKLLDQHQEAVMNAREVRTKLVIALTKSIESDLAQTVYGMWLAANAAHIAGTADRDRYRLLCKGRHQGDMRTCENVLAHLGYSLTDGVLTPFTNPKHTEPLEEDCDTELDACKNAPETCPLHVCDDQSRACQRRTYDVDACAATVARISHKGASMSVSAECSNGKCEDGLVPTGEIGPDGEPVRKRCACTFCHICERSLQLPHKPGCPAMMTRLDLERRYWRAKNLAESVVTASGLRVLDGGLSKTMET